MMLDATIVRAPQQSAGTRKKGWTRQAIGRSRGGLTTKIRAIVASLGNLVALAVTAAKAFDFRLAAPLLQRVERQAFIADKA